MEFSRTQLAIAAGAGALLLLIFFGSLIWLNHQGPVLSRSEERDPLSGIPNSITLNPLRDRSSENARRRSSSAPCATDIARTNSRSGRRITARNMRRSSATRRRSIRWSPGKLRSGKTRRRCASCSTAATRRNATGKKGTYQELFSVTLENKDGEWVVTKYDAMY